MRFIIKWDNNLLISCEFIELSQVANVGLALVTYDITFVKQGLSVLNYSHTFVEEYRLLFLRAKIAEIVRDRMSSGYHEGMSASTYRRYVHIGKVTLRHQHLLDVVKELKEGFLPSQWLGVAVLDEVMFMESDEKAALLPVRAANAFIEPKNAVIYA